MFSPWKCSNRKYWIKQDRHSIDPIPSYWQTSHWWNSLSPATCKGVSDSRMSTDYTTVTILMVTSYSLSYSKQGCHILTLRKLNISSWYMYIEYTGGNWQNKLAIFTFLWLKARDLAVHCKCLYTAELTWGGHTVSKER